MKRGVKWRPEAEAVFAPQNVLGIPILYTGRRDQLAASTGVWPWKRIVVYPTWFNLTERERMAVLLHEAAHCLAFHLEIRLLLIPFFWTRWVTKITRQQELDADAFAVDKGYGVDLISVIAKVGQQTGEHYPTFDERLKHLTERVKARTPRAVA